MDNETAITDEKTDSSLSNPVSTYFSNGGNTKELDNKRRDEYLDNMEKIEKEFTDLKEKFFAERLAAIRKELEMLKNGTHQGYLEGTKILEERRTQKIWLAEQWRQYQLQCINIAFESEKKQAEDEFQNEKRELKEKLAKNILKKRNQLEEEKNTMNLIDGPEIRVSTRSLRKRGKDSKSDKEKQNGQFKRPLFAPEIRTELSENEINEDFEAIKKGLST